MKKVATSTALLKDGKVLFLVRDKKNDTVHESGRYLFIGGKVEPKESLEECAKREVFEESGITVNSVKLKGFLHIIGQGTGEDEWTIFLFTSSDFTGEAVTGSEGSFEWVPLAEIKNIPIYEGDKTYIEYVFTHSFVAVELYYDGFTFLRHSFLSLIP